MSRLNKHYQENVKGKLREKFGYKNAMEIPRIEKVVVNIGVGDTRENPKYLQRAQEELSMITGQHALVSKAKRSVANFKLRKGMNIGCFVTLRRNRMYDFLDRLISVGLPRVRDFRGVNDRAFDGRGNYNLGIPEQLVFPEIPYDKVEKIRGLNVTIVTSAKTDMEARELLREVGMPFRRRDDGEN